MGRFELFKQRAAEVMHTAPLAEEMLLDSLNYQGIPADYLDFLRTVGSGDIADSIFIYDQLMEPAELCETGITGHLDGILCFGHNFDGNLFGFDTYHGWKVVEIDPLYGFFIERGASFAEFIDSLAGILL